MLFSKEAFFNVLEGVALTIFSKGDPLDPYFLIVLQCLISILWLVQYKTLQNAPNTTQKRDPGHP